MPSAGLTGLLKDGYKHFAGLEEAILKNVEACKGLADITRTSLGPNGTLHAPACPCWSGRAGATLAHGRFVVLPMPRLPPHDLGARARPLPSRTGPAPRVARGTFVCIPKYSAMWALGVAGRACGRAHGRAKLRTREAPALALL